MTIHYPALSMPLIRRLIPLAAASWFVLLVAACANATPTPTARYAVEVTTAPAPPVAGTDLLLEARLTDAQGNAVSDATVSFDVDMVMMSHGKHVVAAQSDGAGRFTAPFHFVMAGAWRVIVIVERPGESAEQLRTELTVNPK
jgi:hypothetical protein